MMLALMALASAATMTPSQVCADAFETPQGEAYFHNDSMPEYPLTAERVQAWVAELDTLQYHLIQMWRRKGSSYGYSASQMDEVCNAMVIQRIIGQRQALRDVKVM